MTATSIEVDDLDVHALPPDSLAIETAKLCKRFGEQRVLDQMDLQIPEGARTVVMGPSGTGKSVLLKHITGLMEPDSGDVLIRGRALSAFSRSEVLALRRDIGVMYQDGALFTSMNVFDNVAFPLRQHTNLSEADISEIVEAGLESVGLLGARHRLPNQLSGGMRKRAGLARALALNPTILLCDEPDSGLDPVRSALLGELLVDRHDEMGGTMVVVTHNVALAKLVSEYAIVVFRGGVVAAGPAADVWASKSPFVQQFLAGDTEGPLGMGQ